MKRNEIKLKIKECLKKFDRLDSPDDIVSETLFNIYGLEMNEICRMFEKEFRELRESNSKNSIPKLIYATFDETDGEIFCAFTDKEQCKKEAEESGCGMQTIRLINNND